MGIVYNGIPKELALSLKDFLNINVFVETGTYMGHTTMWAAAHFQEVYTVEASEELFLNAKKSLAVYPNIKCFHGDSAVVLQKLAIRQPVLFWLDAHYSGGNTYKGQFPILNEIDIINAQYDNAVLLIDDARFITSCWTGSQYCELVELIKALDKKKRYIAIFEDVVIVTPEKAKHIVNNYTNKMSKVFWERHKTQSRKNATSKLRKKLSRIKTYIINWISGFISLINK